MKKSIQILILFITIQSFGQIIPVSEKRTAKGVTTQPTIRLIDPNNTLGITPANGVVINADKTTISITDNQKFNSNFEKIKPLIVIDTTGTYTYDYHSKKRKKVATDVVELEKDIRVKSNSVNSPVEIIAMQLKLETYKQQLKSYDVLFDTLRSKAQRQIDGPVNFTHWFPSSNRHWKYTFFNKFYGKTMQKDLFVGNNASFQINDSGTTVQSELLSSYFGPFRVSFGTIIANKTSEAEPDATTNRTTEEAADEASTATKSTLTEGLQLLQSGGGNVYLNLDFPVYGTQTKFATFYTNIYGRASGLFSQMTNSVDTSTGNACTGINVYGSVASQDRKLIAFLNANFAGYAGGTEYYRTLNLTQNKVFAFGQLNIGIDVVNAFRITYTPITVGSDTSLRKISGTIGFQISSEMFKS